MKPEDLKTTEAPKPENCITPEQLTPIARNLFDKIEFDKDEVLIAEIRKHPFGLFIIYLTGMGITFGIFLIFFLVPVLLNGSSDTLGIDLTSLRPVLMFVGLLLFVFSLISTMIGAYLYTHDVILVTSEKITQINYKTIFNRKISQLSIGDVQDTTVSQIGVFSRIFNYGTIEIETAGEQDNYNFTYVPDPYNKSKLIVGSHEVNLTKYGN